MRATENFGEHLQASARFHFGANRAKVKFREQLKILMDPNLSSDVNVKMRRVVWNCLRYSINYIPVVA